MPKTPLSFRETLGETSAQWCERNGIPPGFYVTFVRRSDGRQVRNDFGVHRRPLPKRARDDQTLKAALDDLATTFLTDLNQRRYEVKLRRPDRTNVDGRTQISTVRTIDHPDPDAEDRLSENEEQTEEGRGQINDSIFTFRRMMEDNTIPNLEYGHLVEPMAITRGGLQALVARFGLALVRRAAEAEGIL